MTAEAVPAVGFIKRVVLARDKVADCGVYPFSLPVIRTLGTFTLHPKVTFLVGENGTGKSTLLEAIAVAASLSRILCKSEVI